MKLNKYHKNIEITLDTCTISVSKVRCYIAITIGFIIGPTFMCIPCLMPSQYQHRDWLLIICVLGFILTWYVVLKYFLWARKKHNPIILTKYRVILPDGESFLWKDGAKLKFIQYPVGPTSCYVSTKNRLYMLTNWGLYTNRRTLLYLFKKYSNKVHNFSSCRKVKNIT